MSKFNIRAATSSDSRGLSLLLNEIIEVGGTTAAETPFSPAEFETAYITGGHCVACFVAESESGSELLGFQSLSIKEKLQAGWLDIATFARAEPKVKGVGSALFDMSKAFAIENDYDFINATIRADNVPGLGYYGKMGFQDYSVAKAVPLKSGLLVDRISRKYALKTSD